MATWHGLASFSPLASPKPPGLRLGLIWTLCHPASLHRSILPSLLLLLFTKEALLLKSFIVNPPPPRLAASLPAKCNFSSRAAAAASAKPSKRREKESEGEKKTKKKLSPGPRRLKDESDSYIRARFWNRCRAPQQNQTPQRK